MALPDGGQIGGMCGAAALLGPDGDFVVFNNANRLIVAQGVDNSLLFHSRCTITDLHWITDAADTLPYDCTARIRYRQRDSACRLVATNGDVGEVEFSEPQRAITPGQAIVFYRDEQCLGGATIEQAGRA